MKENVRLRIKLRLLQQKYVSYKDLRLIVGVYGNKVYELRKLKKENPKLECPYDSNLFDVEEVLKLYNKDIKEEIKAIKNKIKEYENND